MRDTALCGEDSVTRRLFIVNNFATPMALAEVCTLLSEHCTLWGKNLQLFNKTVTKLSTSPNECHYITL